MAFDEALANRVRKLVAAEPGLDEKKMFGGVGFLVRGNMSVGIHGSDLIVRVGPLGADAALKQPGARVFDVTGRPMKGWLMVSKGALGDNRVLAAWVKQGLSFARSLPAK